MIDYEALRALDAVIRHQSFSKAASELYITQSAVSQRLRQLEASVGQPLLIRELPYEATRLGERMLALLRQVSLLEQTLADESQTVTEAKSVVKIAVNVDSLELWFLSVLKDKELARSLNLSIIVDDEKFTLRHLKAGKVDLCISAEKQPIQNYESHHLGGMSYVLAATPEFKQRYFPNGLKRAALATSPAVVFNEKDDIHHRFLRDELGFDGEFPFTAVPSVRGFRTAILSGFGYGSLPLTHIKRELESGELVKLQSSIIVRDLYLHHWNYQSPLMKRVITVIQKAARDLK